MTDSATEATQAQRALSLAVLEALAPDHAYHYTGLLSVEVCASYDSIFHEGELKVDLVVEPATCDCGVYLAGEVATAEIELRGPSYQTKPVADLVARLTGVTFV